MWKWFLVIIIVPVPSMEINIDSAFEIGTTFVKVYQTAFKLVKLFHNRNKLTDTEQSIANNLKELQQVANDLNSKADRAYNQQLRIMNLLKNLPDILQNLLLKNDLRKYLVDLNTMYTKYEKYSKNVKESDRYTLEKYANMLVSDNHNSIESILEQIHSIVSPPNRILRRKGILEYLKDNLKGEPFLQLCQINMSAQLTFYHFYGYLTYARVRGVIMKMFGYTLLKIFDNGTTYTREVNLFYNRFVHQLEIELKLVKRHIGQLSRVIWQCDPPVHERGETFIEVTELYQGYIINQYDIIRYNCRYYCPEFNTFRELSCTNTLCQFQRRCAGTIFQCQNHGSLLLTVYLRNPQMNEDRRRYSYAKATGHLGNLNEIKSNDVVKTVEAWWYDHHRCDYCLCTCNDRTHSDRYFNLRPTIANIRENYVVTGLRFVKKYRIIYLQIQEGKLMANGTINGSTITWVPVDGYKLRGKNVKEGVDYHGLDPYADHIHFDDLLTEKRQVIVGVRLTLLQKSKLALSIAIVGVDFSTGLLTMDSEQPRWFTVPVGASRRFLLDHTRVSYFPNSSSTPYDNPSWTYFGATSWAWDTAQTTVPSLDAQPVVSAIPLPLQGAGLYLKSQPNHGGFIAPKIIPHNILDFL